MQRFIFLNVSFYIKFYFFSRKGGIHQSPPHFANHSANTQSKAMLLYFIEAL